MTNNDELALKLAKLAKNAGADEWQAKKISGDQYVIRKGSYRVESGFCTYQEIAEIDDNSTRVFVAYASPANILSLLAERDADKKRISDMQEQLSRYSMSPGEADQRRCESRVVRDALGFSMDSEGVAPVELYEKIYALRDRIAELEARTVSVPTFEEWCQMEDMKPLGWVREAMKEGYDGCRAAAGFKLKVGE